VPSLDGLGAIVTYPAPAVQNGDPPVAVTCTVAQDAKLPLGPTQVTCTATDARQRTASCGFTVTVLPPPWLASTRFLAFGDSITEGVVSAPVTLALLPTPASYPTKLEILLRARYTAQQPAVTNAGIAGELATDGARRLPSVVRAVQPEAVLLMEGTNDLSLWREGGISRAADALEDMVNAARARGARVFLATLPPQREGGKGGGVELVRELNKAIRAVAAEEGAVLVDVYAALVTDLDRYIGADGLHPTEAGYERIAETFLAAIRTEMETPMPVPPPAGFGLSGR